MSGESRASGMNVGWLERHKQTCDPMVEAYWTFWQALAWAIHHDADKVRGTSKGWLMICPTEERREIWLEVSFEASRAQTALIGMVQSGTLTATGKDTQNSIRRDIGALEWLDLEPVGCARAEPQFYPKDSFDRPTLPEPVFRDVRICRVDVLKEFPPAKVSAATSARKRGVRQSKSPGVEAAMRKMDPKALSEMKQEQMAAIFGAAPSTCRAARIKVLDD